MRVLTVCSGNAGGGSFRLDVHKAFVHEQVEAIRRLGIENEVYLVRGRGAVGYLRNARSLSRYLRANRFDLVHAHYGLSGLASSVQRGTPVVTTFHGSDVRDPRNRVLSRVAAALSAWSIFVSERLRERLLGGDRPSTTVLQCGVDLERFRPVDRNEARRSLGLKEDGTYVLFGSSFDRPVKNYPLARAAVDLVPGVELLELDQLSRDQVALMMNASDALLLTSDSEGGGPQVLKEALATNCPVVSVPVGDAPTLLDGLEGCYLAERDPADLASKLRAVIAREGRPLARERVEAHGLDAVARLVVAIYEEVLSRDAPVRRHQ